jgi:hypothetical protein
MVVKTHVMWAAIFAAGACAASAQGAPALPQVAPPVLAPTQVVTPPASSPTPMPQPMQAPPPAPPAAIDHLRRREQIGLMEGVLAAAVRNGAQATARQIQQVQPNLNLLTGVARAQGFYLEGYGVFFHVEIPGVQPSVASIIESLERERNRRQAGAAPYTAGSSAPVMLDPNAAYTQAVQQKLVDAMLDFRIDLLADEWLTVAARDRAPTLTPEIYESITMVLRIKGADLADFLAGRLTREEVRKKVEVREF